MQASDGTPPDLTSLTEVQARRVLRQVRERQFRCPSCGGQDLRVGDALYLGFLFVGEPTDAYMVALTCSRPKCPGARTAIRLHGREFLDDLPTQARGG